MASCQGRWFPAHVSGLGPGPRPSVPLDGIREFTLYCGDILCTELQIIDSIRVKGGPALLLARLPRPAVSYFTDASSLSRRSG